MSGGSGGKWGVSVGACGEVGKVVSEVSKSKVTGDGERSVWGVGVVEVLDPVNRRALEPGREVIIIGVEGGKSCYGVFAVSSVKCTSSAPV